MVDALLHNKKREKVMAAGLGQKKPFVGRFLLGGGMFAKKRWHAKQITKKVICSRKWIQEVDGRREGCAAEGSQNICKKPSGPLNNNARTTSIRMSATTLT